MRYKIVGVDARDSIQQRDAIVEARDEAAARAEAARLGIDVSQATVVPREGGLSDNLRFLSGLFVGGLGGGLVGGLVGYIVGAVSMSGGGGDAPGFVEFLCAMQGVVYGAPVGSLVGVLIAFKPWRR